VLFTRDLRVRDNPALATACEQADLVVPLFAVDARLMSAANRIRFLLDSLADLRESLRARGGDLAVRHPLPAPHTVRLPPGLRAGELPAPGGGVSPRLQPGGETVGWQRARAWLDGPLSGYTAGRDDLASDQTSRLSAYLRFGCVSPLGLASLARRCPGGGEFVRQLAWRDFFHQVTAAFPDMARTAYRPREQRWRRDQDAFDAWRAGRTGIPIVDAGLRQLAAEGYMHNRARLITAHFLTRILEIDWRLGYRHFLALLADGDVASNAGNWQWAAGTGNNPRPGQTMNMLRQARRFDFSGDYVRCYIPELAGLNTPDIHMPWRVPPALRRQLRYPEPMTA
jgi:deoxyribodipyrimidine photo-lyase